MSNINPHATQIEAQEDYSLVVKQGRIEVYNNKIKKFCLLIGVISLSLCIFFAFAHLVLGTSQFFNLRFSLPAVIQWLDHLPSVFIENPESLLARAIIGGVFFLLYVIFSVILVKNVIKSISKLSYLCDLTNTNIDHKVLALECMDLTFNCFKLVFFLSIMGTTTGASIPVGGALSIIIYSIAFILFSAAKLFYTCYDSEKNEFFSQAFTVNAVKTLSMIIFAIIALLLSLGAPFAEFIQNLITNYNNPADFTGPAFIKQFAMPFVKMLYGLYCFSILILTIKLDKKSTMNITSSFYGRVYQVNNFGLNLKNKITKRTKFIVFLIILSVVAEVFLTCFNTNNALIIPSGIGTLLAKTLFGYSSIIFIVLGINQIAKTNLKIPNPVIPQTTP